jgi:AP-1 complex subunit beta-1
VSPALLEELVSDLSSLASAYHKPESTFIGRGRFGADALSKKRDEITREKALATVVQGQQAENLLDFGDDDETMDTAKNGTVPAGLGGLDELMADASIGNSNQSKTNVQSQKSQLNDLLGL